MSSFRVIYLVQQQQVCFFCTTQYDDSGICLPKVRSTENVEREKARSFVILLNVTAVFPSLLLSLFQVFYCYYFFCQFCHLERVSFTNRLSLLSLYENAYGYSYRCRYVLTHVSR